MLKRTLKLMKYDLGAMVKYWWVVALITPIAALAAALLYRGYFETMVSMADSLFDNMHPLFYILLTFFTMAEMIGAQVAAIIFAVTAAATQIIVFIRFFKHFYTDEGYLTFTLPVSRRELYISKVLSSMIVIVAQQCIMTVGVLLIALIAPPTDYGLWVFEPEMWAEIFEWMKHADFWGILALLLVNGAVCIFVSLGSIFTDLTLIQMCITLGSVVAKRGKVFVGIGFWYVLSYVFSGVISLLTTAFYFLFIASLPFIFELTVYHFLFGCIPLLIMIAAIFWAFGFLFYNITQALIDKKLNLA